MFGDASVLLCMDYVVHRQGNVPPAIINSVGTVPRYVCGYVQ